MANFRVGIGQDSHKIKFEIRNSKFEIKKPLILGGVVVDKKITIEADSDGDVILHALCNALSSAIAGDSLGTWADKICLEQGTTDSQEFVKVVMRKVKKTGYKVNNVSIAVEAKRPKVILPQVGEMKKTMGKLLAVSKDCLGITFTSGEGLTAFGQGEGIQVLAIVSLINQ